MLTDWQRIRVEGVMTDRYLCKDCNRNFQNQSELDQHNRREHARQGGDRGRTSVEDVPEEG